MCSRVMHYPLLAKRLDWLLAAFVFVVFCIIYLMSPISQSMDSRWNTHLTMSILVEHDLDLDEYASIIPEGDYRVQTWNGHRYLYFPLGAPLMAVPFTYLYSLFDPRVYTDIESVFIWPERLAASAWTALAAAVMYLIARRSLKPAAALLIAAVLAFATPAWSTASRAMWQHGPSMLMLALALYLYLLARERPWIVQFVALPLAWAYVIRPTNSLSVLAFTLLVFLEYRRYFLRYLAWAMVIAVPFVALNFALYGSLLPPYYIATRLGRHAMFGTALAANLISPSRGVFVYSPILLLSFAGGYLKARARQFAWLDAALAAIVVLHWIVISSFPVWWAGSSFGPRFSADIMPYLVYFLIPVTAALLRPRGHALRLAFAALLAVSVFVHWRGATAAGTQEWIYRPKDADLQLARFWDWRDPQFLRGTHVLDCFWPLPVRLLGESMHLYRAYGDAREETMLIYVDNSPQRRVRLTSEGSGSLNVVRVEAEPETFVLAVEIKPGLLMTGTHDLGSVVIRAASAASCPWPGPTSTMESKFLLTVGSWARVYLPFVADESP